MSVNPSINRRDVILRSLVGAAAIATMPANRAGAAVRSAQDAENATTIQYWYSEGSAIGSSVPTLVDRFEAANPGVSVEVRSYVQYREVVQALQAALAAGEPPTVAQVGYDYLRYATANFPHLPIAVAAADPDGAAFLDRFPQRILALGRVDGVQEGLPFVVAGTYLVYNSDLLDDAGIAPPRTWSEVRDAARLVKQASGAAGLAIPDSGDFWNLQALLESNGARLLIEEDGRYRTGIASAEAIEAMQFYADMVLQDESAVPTSWEQGIPVFTSGQIAMFMGGGGIVSSALQNGDFAVGSVPVPTFGDKPRRVPVGGNNHFIFATEEADQQVAWAFLKFLNEPESVTYWIENTGFLPPIEGVADDPRYLKPFFDKTPQLRVDFEQLPDMVPWVSWPGSNGLEAYQALSDAREKILTGEAEVSPAFAEAAARIDELIAS